MANFLRRVLLSHFISPSTDGGGEPCGSLLRAPADALAYVCSLHVVSACPEGPRTVFVCVLAHAVGPGRSNTPLRRFPARPPSPTIGKLRRRCTRARKARHGEGAYPGRDHAGGVRVTEHDLGGRPSQPSLLQDAAATLSVRIVH